MIISFEHVRKKYAEMDSPVFCDFSAAVEQGEFILLTGESGVGKTTLIRLLLRETDPDGGRIEVFGQDIGSLKARDIPYYRRKIGTVFQESPLVPEKSVYENVEMARLIIGGRKEKNRMAISSIFRLLGITDLYHSYPRELSGGEKQKVCLARALANYPSLILADEPTGNLSPGESREIMGLFELIHRQGITVVVATHDKENAAGLFYREIPLGMKG